MPLEIAFLPQTQFANRIQKDTVGEFGFKLLLEALSARKLPDASGLKAPCLTTPRFANSILLEEEPRQAEGFHRLLRERVDNESWS
jgi:hypothetical protein